MATRLLPFQPPSLAFPAGRAPGFDQAHPAAQGISGVHGFSVVALGNGMVCVTTGQAGTVAGTVGSGIFSPQGPVISFASSAANNVSFKGTTIHDVVGTGAIIGSLGSVTSGACFLFTDSGNTGGFRIDLSGTSFEMTMPFVAAVPSTITAVVNVPFFLAFSKGPTVVNFVYTNLLTGAVTTSVVADTHTPGTPGTATVAIGGVAGAGSIVGNIAAAMFAPTFLSLQQLQAWAADPWGFWYPRPPAQQFSIVGIPKYQQRIPLETRYVRRDTFDVSLRSQADVYQYAPLLQIQPSPAQNQNYDWPNPLVPGYSIELRTWLQQSVYSLITVMPPIQNDWPSYKPLTTVPVQWIWPTPAVMISPAFGTGKRRPLFIAGKGGFPPSYWPDGNG